ncbi:penicillin-binding protein [Longispora fulva]|uniref:CubicO group peptidase (Beta-lactamase class C family) n=1 Tax=Longispora fulva TaxID=619741 RepID=A0A8J7GEW3_9ACTN|nr:serine hydrolase domain-containing protein [Longispora fulva]MBG6136466.1 CubicO group peptidase (beta-lactamase class C family) [Longispora fulva]GIG59634.1 penicillin-binding protein [Longispora fulva]
MAIMEPSSDERSPSRRGVLRGAAGLLIGAAAVSGVAATAGCSAFRSKARSDEDELFGELDGKIEKVMKDHAIPGVAVGVWAKGREHVRGYGVTSLANPQPVDGDTLFRIGSTTKTYTGTAVMRLVEAGKLNLDATVRTYLPDFAAAGPGVAEAVTLRQLLNHTPGWLGDFYQDFGRGEDALTRYVTGMAALPQLTALGSTFAYNNAAIDLAGRVIEKVTGSTYEKAVQDLLLDPLKCERTRFFADELVGYRTSASHTVADGKAKFDASGWYIPRSLGPTGGLMSTAKEQLAWARFHMGDGTGPGGVRVLSRDSLVAMRSNPGPGGTLAVELDGMGVAWHLRPSAEGVRIVQHGGTWRGQHSGFIMVPDRDFALTVLTNSESGSKLVSDLTVDDWALKKYAGISNLPATPQTLSASQLAPYEGRYEGQVIFGDGKPVDLRVQLTADQGRLKYRALSPEGDPMDPEPGVPETLAFYREDYVLPMDGAGKPFGSRANFLRGPDGRVQWFRENGRLSRKAA